VVAYVLFCFTLTRLGDQPLILFIRVGHLQLLSFVFAPRSQNVVDQAILRVE
jgi:hypothetical protein